MWVGNALWLDFVNTAIMQNGQDIDLLGDDADVAAWGTQAGITAFAAEAAQGGAAPTQAHSLLDAAREFRQVLHRLAVVCAAGGVVSGDILDAVNARLGLRQGHDTLSRHETEYALVFHEVGTGEDILFARLARSAAELLAGGDAHLVRKCENPACVLYFYDNSKNHARRWCSMSGCGNRHKQQAHYQRKRKTA